MLVALFGIAAGLTVIWYTAQFQALYFLQNALRIDDNAARLMIGIGAVFSLFWFILFGWLSDRVGRKKPILLGYALTIVLMFPLFHWMASAANPELAAAMERNRWSWREATVSYDPSRPRARRTALGRVLDTLSKKGIAYSTRRAPRARRRR